MESDGGPAEPQAPTLIDKIGRQCRKHPLIPAGMVATVGALSMAFKRMHQRDAVGYQRWLRARVVAQGLTVVAIVAAGVQEMGVGVLTGNARPATPQPTLQWESVEFEKRLKGAEEAHRMENTGVSVVGVASTPATNGTATEPPAFAPTSQTQTTSPTSSSSSTLLSWLGFSRK